MDIILFGQRHYKIKTSKIKTHKKREFVIELHFALINAQG